MRAIVTVLGKDHVGIIAGICNALAKHGVNVLDINQTVMQEFLTMNMLVDTSAANVNYTELVAALEAITDALAEGERVQLVGFGSFEVKARAERLGRNPQTGEAVAIPASKSPVFKAAKSLKDAVNQ